MMLKSTEIYRTTSSIKFRKAASANSRAFGTIKEGTEIKIIDKSNPEWFKTEYNGKIGFLSSKYLTLVQMEPKKVAIAPAPVKEEETSSGWGWILLIGAVISYILHRRSKKKQVMPQNNSKPSSEIPNKEPLINKININSSKTNDNDSIIDVTGKSQPLNTGLMKYIQRVPPWKHQYIYSYSELEKATYEQKVFYKIFKNAFLAGQYLDLEGNLNYAFILLFDLSSNYDKSSYEIQKQLTALGKYYPKTESYAISIINEKAQKAKGVIVEINTNYSQNSYTPSYDYDDWKLGNRYKAKLNLKSNEVKLLNVLIDTNNKFNSIEHFAIELIKLFLHCVSSIESVLKKQGTTIQEQANAIAAIEIAKHYRYRAGSYNYKSVYDIFINNIYQVIYKICENKLRDVFDVGRKTDLSWYIHAQEALLEFKFKLEIHLTPLLNEKVKEINQPDLKAEISLNEYNKGRWKGKLETLEVNFDKNKLENYINAIQELERANQKNPSIENIFFQASKFISKHDKITALKFYIDYLYYDLKSVKFDNKQLTKNIQKSLFANDQQLREFEEIVSNLVKEKNRKKALEAIPNIYLTKRKKIVLDTTTIKEVNEKHADTVELLNEYLQDENEDTENKIALANEDSSEVKITITTMVENEAVSLPDGIKLNINQLELLELINKNSYAITASQAETFAKSKGLFKNQLVESINEACYERLDDLLIEEEDENYTINEIYYQKLFS